MNQQLDQAAIIQHLAHQPLVDALGLIRNDVNFQAASRTEVFYTSHLQFMNNQPRNYSTIIQCNPPQQRRFGEFPLTPPNANIEIRTFHNIYLPVLISSCDGIIALFGNVADVPAHMLHPTRLHLWNPYLNRHMQLEALMPRFHPRDVYLPVQDRRILRFTIGFGRLQPRIYTFFIYYQMTRTVVLYYPRTSTFDEQHVYQRRFHLQGITCEVTVGGVPYWRGGYGSGPISNNDLMIFHPVIANGQVTFDIIAYPEIHLPHGNYRSNHLQEFQGNVGFMDYVFGGEVLYCNIWVRVDGEWELVREVHINMQEGPFWMTPDVNMILRDGNSNLVLRRIGDHDQVIGNYNPTILNHRNTLAFIENPI